MSDWQIEQLTHGSERGVFHSHSYYDIGVFASDSRHIAAHRLHFVERPPTSDDVVEVGVIDTDDGSWRMVGESRAWSWQQGPMAQWIPGQRSLVWNDRESDGQNNNFVTRVHDMDTGVTRTLARPSYAIDPNGLFTLSLNMARLDDLHPGYGYVGGAGAQLNKRHPRNDGVWRQSFSGGEAVLVLSLERAVHLLHARLGRRIRLRHFLKRYRYWFNHVKLSPDGSRFTVKLRFREPGPNSSWNDSMGISLTCGVDGRDLRLLTNATSHVIWLDDQSLYLWQLDGFYLYADEAPKGRRLRQIGIGLVEANAHLRYFPGSTKRFVFDTPYRESIDLFIHDEADAATDKIAHFVNHRPKSGQYRCDLHPCPSPDGRRIVVTSMDDGGRQIYLLRETTSRSGREPSP